MINENANVAGANVNNSSSPAPRDRSTFPDLSYHFFNTHRFGEYTPHFVFDGESGDHVPYLGSHKIDSYSLRAPLMQDILIKKDYYEVPMEAILPNNWELWYTNPTTGDDVPDSVGTGVANFWATCANSWANQVTKIRSYITGTASEQNKLTAVLRFLTFYENFFSNGSLMTSLGNHGSKHFRCKGVVAGYTFQYGTYDEFFDRCISSLLGTVQGIVEASVTYQGHIRWLVIGHSVSADAKYVDYPVCSMRDVLQMFRDDPTTTINSVTFAGTGSVANTIGNFFDTSKVHLDVDGLTDSPCDFARMWAYQLVCAHFYTNDVIDPVFSADTYRSYLGFFVKNSSSLGFETFTRNGVEHQYDYMSGHYVSRSLSLLAVSSNDFSSVGTTSAFSYAVLYLSAMMSYRRSLRYMDYFVGSRSRPLAVGNVNVDVNSGSPDYVSVIDVTRNIQKQKFLNACNRIGRQFDDYIQGLTGVRPAVDYHNPLYLAHTKDSAFAREVENTGAAQMTDPNSVTARISSSGGRFQFEFRLDRPAVILGITYFDIPRVYKYSTERQWYILNRFDRFNPFMQFVGDQPVYFDEIGCNRAQTVRNVFAYQLRHMEYKQRYDQCAGGFVHNLPAYIFDDETDNFRNHSSIDDDFIRSYNSELDPFYVSLTGYSLGSYFHFIVDHYNDCPASREMAYAPSIL